MRPGLAMTLADGVIYRVGRAVAQGTHRVDVAQQRLLRAHLCAPLVHRREEVQVNHVTTQLAHAAQDAARVTADVQPHATAQCVNAIHQALLVGPYELFVDTRADQ